MRERLRWRIAYAFNRLPGQCWADLVSWALAGMRVSRKLGYSPLPWRPVTETCRNDALTGRDRCCYCAKLGADGKARRG